MIEAMNSLIMNNLQKSKLKFKPKRSKRLSIDVQQPRNNMFRSLALKYRSSGCMIAIFMFYLVNKAGARLPKIPNTLSVHDIGIRKNLFKQSVGYSYLILSFKALNEYEDQKSFGSDLDKHILTESNLYFQFYLLSYSRK